MFPSVPELYSAVPYAYANGPYRKHDIHPHEEGINCQLFLHLMYEQEFGISLPMGMYSQELYRDTEFFRNLMEGERLMRGDVMLFGQPELTDFRKLHMTFVSGEYDAQENPYILHCTSTGNGVQVWPLERFARYEKYRTLYAVKRLQDDLHRAFVLPAVYGG